MNKKKNVVCITRNMFHYQFSNVDDLKISKYKSTFCFFKFIKKIKHEST